MKYQNIKICWCCSLLLGMLLCFNACYKDKGNYEYSNSERITISGIEEAYSVQTLTDELVIEPEITTSEKEVTLSYWWGIYAKGEVGKIDTISRDRILKYKVQKGADEWVLVFNVTDERSGYRQSVRSDLIVNSQFNRGWYILKDDQDSTDVDLLLTAKNSLPTSRIDGLFSAINGHKLAGGANSIHFKERLLVQGNEYAQALLLSSSEDISALEVNSAKELRQYDNFFYSAPKVKKPMAFFPRGLVSDVFLINESTLYYFPSNLNKFGLEFTRAGAKTPYKLSKYYLANATYLSPIFYDEVQSSFMNPSTYNLTLNQAIKNSNSKMPTTNLNKDMLFMGLKSVDPFVGVALLQDRTDRNLNILADIDASNGTLNIKADTLAKEAKIIQGKTFGILMAEEDMIYFAVGREIWSRILSNGKEKLQYTLPSDEEIDFIRHRKYATRFPFEKAFESNYVFIGSHINGQYKIRAFKKSAGNLDLPADFTVEGKGRAKDILYMSPFVVDSTYPTSY